MRGEDIQRCPPSTARPRRAAEWQYRRRSASAYPERRPTSCSTCQHVTSQGVASLPGDRGVARRTPSAPGQRVAGTTERRRGVQPRLSSGEGAAWSPAVGGQGIRRGLDGVIQLAKKRDDQLGWLTAASRCAMQTRGWRAVKAVTVSSTKLQRGPAGGGGSTCRTGMPPGGGDAPGRRVILPHPGGGEPAGIRWASRCHRRFGTAPGRWLVKRLHCHAQGRRSHREWPTHAELQHLITMGRLGRKWCRGLEPDSTSPRTRLHGCRGLGWAGGGDSPAFRRVLPESEAWRLTL